MDSATVQVDETELLSPEEQTNLTLAAAIQDGMAAAEDIMIQEEEQGDHHEVPDSIGIHGGGSKRKERDQEEEVPVAPSSTAGTNIDNLAPSTTAGVLEDAALSPPRTKRPRLSFEERVRELQAYKEEHGNLNIPIRYKKNPSLGKFVHNTREQYKLFNKQTPPQYAKKCSLTADRIKALDDIGFIWTCERPKKQQDDWNSRFEQLQAYKEKHGDCNVPHGFPEDPAFAEWIHRQRTTHASIQKKPDSKGTAKGYTNLQERMDRLAEIGFSFTVHSDVWMEHWNMLKEYRDKNGDSKVPTHYAANPRLGRWVHTQRHQRRLLEKGKQSTITQERIAKLDELDFPWNVRSALDRPRVSWDQRFEELKEFKEKNGHFRIGSGPLYQWSVEQRSRLRSLEKNGKEGTGNIKAERVEKFLSIGFDKDTELSPENSNTGRTVKEAEVQNRDEEVVSGIASEVTEI